jgi:hypothetical protein
MADGGDDDTMGYTIISGAAKEPEMMIMGYENMPLVSLEEAVEPLISILPRVRGYAQAAKNRCKPIPDDNLTRDASAAIILHSMKWEPRRECLQFALSLTLRSEDRQKIKPWFLYLKLMLTTLSRLPSTRRSVYRGIKKDLSKEYPDGKIFMWRGLCLCTSSIEILEKEQFLGKTGLRTIFEIDCDSGKDITNHSYYKSEQEILLLPARQFKVIACLQPKSNLHIIQLKEISLPFPLFQQLSLDFDLKKSSSGKTMKFVTALDICHLFLFTDINIKLKSETSEAAAKPKTGKIQGSKSSTTDKPTKTKINQIEKSNAIVQDQSQGNTVDSPGCRKYERYRK